MEVKSSTQRGAFHGYLPNVRTELPPGDSEKAIFHQIIANSTNSKISQIGTKCFFSE